MKEREQQSKGSLPWALPTQVIKRRNPNTPWCWGRARIASRRLGPRCEPPGAGREINAAAGSDSSPIAELPTPRFSYSSPPGTRPAGRLDRPM